MASLVDFKWESVVDELASSAPLLTTVIAGKEIQLLLDLETYV